MATVQHSLFVPPKRAPCKERAVVDLLALTRVKGLGDEGLAKLVGQLRRDGRGPHEIFQASREELCEQFSLRAEAAETISRGAKRLASEAEQLHAKAKSLGVSVLVPGTAEYPERLESFYDSAPPVLYVLGNRDLFSAQGFAIVNSASPAAECLAYTFALASRLAEAGKTLLTSPETASYNLAGLGGKISGANRVVVLHRGLFDFLDGATAREPLPLARHASGELDLERTLLVSPFRLDGRWQKANGTRRDALLVALADTVVAMQVKAGGAMEKLCRQAHAGGRRLFACQFAGSRAAGTANDALLAAGAMSLVPDEAGANVDLLLRDASFLAGAARPDDDLARRRAIGQFFTPPVVAGFVWDALDLLAPSKKSRRAARAVDPACGEGVFLRAALDRGHEPAALWGVDLDENLLHPWRADSQLRHAQLFRANGLVDNPAIGFESGSFDIVVGNPPFAGQGLKPLLRLIDQPAPRRIKSQLDLLGGTAEKPGDDATPILPPHERAVLDHLVRHLAKYDCWRLRDADDDEPLMDDNAGRLFADLDLPPNRAARPDDYEKLASLIDHGSPGRPLDVAQPRLKNAIRRMATTAIEVYFLERFVRLAKPGGLIAAIVPESILASDRLSPLRDWLMEHAILLAVVTLPQKVFTGVGAKARTGILFARRFTEAEQAAVPFAKPIGEGCRIPEWLLEEKVFMISPRPEDDGFTLEYYLETILDIIRDGKPRSAQKGDARK